MCYTFLFHELNKNIVDVPGVFHNMDIIHNIILDCGRLGRVTSSILSKNTS